MIILVGERTRATLVYILLGEPFLKDKYDAGSQKSIVKLGAESFFEEMNPLYMVLMYSFTPTNSGLRLH